MHSLCVCLRCGAVGGDCVCSVLLERAAARLGLGPPARPVLAVYLLVWLVTLALCAFPQAERSAATAAVAAAASARPCQALGRHLPPPPLRRLPLVVTPAGRCAGRAAARRRPHWLYVALCGCDASLDVFGKCGHCRRFRCRRPSSLRLCDLHHTRKHAVPSVFFPPVPFGLQHRNSKATEIVKSSSLEEERHIISEHEYVNERGGQCEQMGDRPRPTDRPTRP